MWRRNLPGGMGESGGGRERMPALRTPGMVASLSRERVTLGSA